MVLTWNVEPSAEQDRALPREVVRSHKFPEVPRFRRDGTSSIPNFLNGTDGQNHELSLQLSDRDTNTHTQFSDRLCATESALSIAEEVQTSLFQPACMKSTRPKSGTNKSYLSNDPRFDLLHEPYVEPIGPGSYWIEGGSPDLGPLPSDSPSRGMVPARDPLRTSASFISSPRQPFWLEGQPTPSCTYINPDFKGSTDKAVEWHRVSDKRAEVCDYRYAARYKESLKDLPDVDINLELDRACKHTTIAASAQEKKTNVIPFLSKTPRFALLPKDRLNDVRLGVTRSDEDIHSLGPGTYGPFTSIGSGKRKTYRLYSLPQPPGIIGYGAVYGYMYNGANGTGHYGGGVHGSYGNHFKRGSAAFMTTPRQAKAGPFSWKTDSKVAGPI